MFLLDLYRWCESWNRFNRQQLAKFVFDHRECDRLARAANTDRRTFASMVSREFFGRMATAGYLDIKYRYAIARPSRRPFCFELYSLEGMKNEYIREMMNIGDMSDDELFGVASANRRSYEALRRKFNLA